MKRLISFTALLAIMFFWAIHFVSAYYGQLYYLSPEYLFNSEWFRLILAFVFFYAVIFFGALKAFRHERSVAVIVAFILALLISYALWARGYLDWYVDSNFGDWLIVIAFFVILGVVVRFLYSTASDGMLITGLVAVWLILWWMYRISAFPFVLPAGIEIFFEILTGWIGFILLIITCAIVWFNKPSHEIRLTR